MTFGNVKFHLPIGLPLCEAVQVWQSVGDFIFLYKTHSPAKGRTDDLIFSGRSFIKMRNRTDPRPILGGHQIGPGLDLRLDHPIPLFESAQRIMS